MALPKKRKTNIDVKVVDPQGGPKNWVDQFLDKNKQFLPRDVGFEDLDTGFIEFVENDLGVTLKGEKVPVNFLTLQRWNEFTKTWPNTDDFKNVKIPFISVVRRPNPETGTNPADFKIPIRKNFPYMQIPIWDGNRKGADIYGIPNPVGVDMIYTVRFFTFKMRELNVLAKKVMQTFASAQAYVNIKGHYFPILLESIGDESQITDLNAKRYYVQTFEMKLQGYIVDTEEFEVKPAVSRLFVTTEIDERRPRPITKFITDGSDDKSLKIIIQFLPNSPNTVTFNPDTNVEFISTTTENVDSITFYKNNVITQLPFTATPSDSIGVAIVRNTPNEISQITINGKITV